MLQTGVLSVVVLVICWIEPAAAQVAQFCDPEIAADSCGERSDPAAACRAVLKQDPYRLSARITLCDVYVARDDVVEASVLIAEGLDICGSRSYVCNRLQVARSNISERGMPTDRRREWEAKMEARSNFCLGAVSIYDTAINACKEALVARPGDPALHQALAAKYRAREMTAAALISYGNAVEQGAADLDVLIAEVELERNSQADACLAGGDLPSCDTAVLPGADDEFRLQRQRGELLLAAGQPEAALEAFSIAQSLDPGEQAVAGRLLTLFETLGSEVREDPSRWTARSYALLASGQELEAMVLRNRIPVLFEDQRMEALGGSLFEAAEQRRDGVVARDCLHRSDERALIDCRKLLVAGLPDYNRIERHLGAVARELEQQRVATAVADDTTGDRAGSQDAREPRIQDPEPVPVATATRTYSNALSDNEVTY